MNWVVSTLMLKITKKLVYLAFRYNKDGISLKLKPITEIIGLSTLVAECAVYLSFHDGDNNLNLHQR